MKRDYRLYVDDIRACILTIEDYLKDISENDFKNNIEKQDAVIRRIEIIGEASRNIPRALKEVNRDIPWEILANFRNYIAHSYFETSLDRIWKIAKYDIPKLKLLFRKIRLV
ncbi:MAG: HepT-like ribonuclease domain-containing protein [Nanoarchaeota archaeon]